MSTSLLVKFRLNRKRGNLRHLEDDRKPYEISSLRRWNLLDRKFRTCNSFPEVYWPPFLTHSINTYYWPIVKIKNKKLLNFVKSFVQNFDTHLNIHPKYVFRLRIVLTLTVTWILHRITNQFLNNANNIIM